MLHRQVGSIQFTAEIGQTYSKGDELGYFAFGGSTCIAIFQKGSVVVDEDIISNRSASQTELHSLQNGAAPYDFTDRMFFCGSRHLTDSNWDFVIGPNSLGSRAAVCLSLQCEPGSMHGLKKR